MIFARYRMCFIRRIIIYNLLRFGYLQFSRLRLISAKGSTVDKKINEMKIKRTERAPLSGKWRTLQIWAGT